MLRSLLFTALFLAMMPVALRYAHVATMLWVWVATVSPVHYIFGFAQQIPFNKLVVGIAVIALLVDRQFRPKLVLDTHLVVLLSFLAVAMVSYLFAISSIARVDELADRLVKVVLLCLFVAATIRTRLHIHSVMIAACMGMGIHGAIEAAKFVATAGGHVLLGPKTIGDNNHFGLAIMMTIPPLIYLYRYSEALIVKLAFGAATMANLIGVVASNSRGALVGLVAMGGIAFLKSRNKAVTLLVLVLVGGTGLALAPDRWQERMNTIKEADEDSSFMSRIGAWKMNLLVAIDRPLTGGGFSSMEDPLVFTKYVRNFASLDFLVTSPPPARTFAAHSIYFQVLGDTGFLGLALFLALMAIAWRNVSVTRRLAADREDLQWARDMALAMQFSLVAYAVSGAALSMAYFEFYYLLITIAAITRRYVEQEVGVTGPAWRNRFRPVHPAFQVGPAAARGQIGPAAARGQAANRRFGT